MNLRYCLFGLMLLLSSAIHAQDSLTTRITPSDTLRLNPNLGIVVEYQMPKIYNEWFKRITDCEGISLPPQEELNRLRFFMVNSELFRLDTIPTNYGGVTFSRQHIIFLALPYVWNYSVVMHEFMHFALWYNYGDKYSHEPNSHPLEYFTKCSLNPYLL